MTPPVDALAIAAEWLNQAWARYYCCQQMNQGSIPPGQYQAAVSALDDARQDYAAVDDLRKALNWADVDIPDRPGRSQQNALLNSRAQSARLANSWRDA